MKNSVVITLMACYASLTVHSQSPVQVIQPSPEAAAITKYGLYPVSQFTGVPKISVPLYEINVSSVKIPISLDYHASGIRVDDYASSVGLAWILNAGGAITRTVMGVPDDDIQKGLFANPPKRQHEVTGSFSDYEYFYNITNKDLDSEPDVFSFNFSGRAGKFFFKPDKTALTVSYENLLIQWLPSGNFKITDEYGNVFLFEEKLISSSYVGDGSAKYWPVTAWYLTSITPADFSEVVTFTYESVTSATLRSHSQSYNLGYTPVPQCHQDGSGNWTCLVSSNDVNETVNSTSFLNTQYKHLKSIAFRSGIVDFKYHETTIDYSHRVLDSVIVTNKSGQGVKKYSLSHEYFFSDAGYNPFAFGSDKNRLKLTKVEEISQLNGEEKIKHEFEYEESIQLPPRKNFGIDEWGYYNGASGNTTLIALDDLGNQYSYKSMNSSGKVTSTIVPANRTPSETHMKAGMLKKIKYPSGGYTEFEFEANEYKKFKKTDIGPFYNVFASIDDPVPPVRVKTFTMPSGTNVSTEAKLTLNIPEWNSINKPSVVLKNITTGSFVEYKTFSGDPRFRVITVSLVRGHDYELNAHVDVDPNNPNQDPDVMNVSANLKTQIISQTEVTEKGGGLRVKAISSYASSGSLATKETYKYGAAENGLGRMSFFPFLFSKRTYEQLYSYQLDIPTGFTCPVPGELLHIMDRPFYSASDFGGSKIAYQFVTSYQEGNNLNNGKTSYEYEFEFDERAESDYPDALTLVDMSWKSGQLIAERKYKRISSTQYDIVHEKIMSYSPFYKDEMYVLRVGSRKIYPVSTYPSQPGFPYCGQDFYDDFYYFEYPIKSAAKKLTKSIERTYTSNISEPPLTLETDYFYDNSETLLETRVVSTDSKGETVRTIYRYPHDFVTQAPYSDMVNNRHIWNTVVEKQIEKGNSSFLTATKTNYNFWNSGSWGLNTSGSIVVPQSVEVKTLTNDWEARMLFPSYDAYGNLTEQQKQDDYKISYLWDYNHTYPIAEVKNAAINDIAYTSFESEGNGGWTFNGTPIADNSSFTGRKVFNVVNSTNNISKNSLNSSATYIVSYWKRSGAISVNGSSPSFTGVTLNGWTFYEHSVANPIGGTITVSGSNGVIDELRLYPATAQMTTYTYDPLIGITSVCDANNMVSYYTYDAFNRLSLVLDKNRSILRKVCYNYSGQPVSCDIFSSISQSGNYTRNNCSAGFTGGSYYVSIPAGMFTSTVSQADANAQATAYGQAQANIYGACTSSSVTILCNNNVSPGTVYMQYYNENTNQMYNFSATQGSNINLGTIPAGTYSITIGTSNPMSNYYFTVACGFFYYGNNATFYNVTVNSSCRVISISPY